MSLNILNTKFSSTEVPLIPALKEGGDVRFGNIDLKAYWLLHAAMGEAMHISTWQDGRRPLHSGMPVSLASIKFAVDNDCWFCRSHPDGKTDLDA